MTRFVLALLVICAVNVSAETPWTLKMHQELLVTFKSKQYRNTGQRYEWVTEDKHIRILRVPGGWLYDQTFVPWTEEKPKADTADTLKAEMIRILERPNMPKSIPWSQAHSLPDTVKSEEEQAKCEHEFISTGIVLLSFPAQDQYRCIKCGKLHNVIRELPTYPVYTEKELDK
jgi:hypothetical protein